MAAKKTAKKKPARRGDQGSGIGDQGKARKRVREKLKRGKAETRRKEATKPARKREAGKKGTESSKPAKAGAPLKPASRRRPSKKPVGRPTIYSAKLAGRICAELAEGKSMRKICEDPAMPGRTTVARWLEDDEEFRSHYARAREDGADALLEEMLKIADDTSQDLIPSEFGPKPNTAAVARAKLQVDLRKWWLSKLDARRYGDKVAVTGDGDKPIPMEITVSPESLAAIQAATAAAAKVVPPAAALEKERAAQIPNSL